jgi:hypothetical protein
MITSRRILRLLLVVAVILLPACYSRNANTNEQSVILLVNNRGFYDVNVFALRATVVAGRRLGTVSGNSQTTLKVPISELQPGGGLVVSVRTVGGRWAWVSPAVQVGNGIVARLDVIQTGSGELTQSQLFSQVVQQANPP